MRTAYYYHSHLHFNVFEHEARTQAGDHSKKKQVVNTIWLTHHENKAYDLSIYTSAFASVLGVIDLRVEIHTSEINEYLFFLWWSVTTKKSKSILTKC